MFHGNKGELLCLWHINGYLSANQLSCSWEVAVDWKGIVK